MRTVKLISLAAIGLIAAAACNREDVNGGADARSISIQASIGEMTKVLTTGYTAVFEAGDQVSLFAWTGSATAVPAEKVVNGVKNTLGTDGKWTPETQMLWADMVTPHYFLGICPARTVTDFTADPFTLNPADYAASDLLIATNVTGLKAQDNPVSLGFHHAMAMLNVNLSFRNQWDGEPTVTAVSATAKKSATIAHLTGLVTASGTAEAVALTSKANNAWSGLQVPQSGVHSVTVTIGGKDYVYTHNSDIPLASGKYTTVNLVIGRDTIELASAITIDDWTNQGDAINGDVFKPEA